jgi:hypothetical protein
MLCEAKPGDNTQHRDTAEGKKLGDTVPLLKKKSSKSSHLSGQILQQCKNV